MSAKTLIQNSSVVQRHTTASRPLAPPFYRPQSLPRVLRATPVLMKRSTAPPVYRPQQVTVMSRPVLQAKRPAFSSQTNWSKSAAPAVYRPQSPPAMLQAKPASSQRETSQIHVSAPVRAGKGSYRITAGAGGQQVGSVMVHERDRSSIEVTDLGVNSAHRKQGLGNALIASALRAGLQMGKTRVVLNSQDNGSGRLTNWYQG
ncbi:MAG: GNAT family N-acetyltransferase, partial [Acidobacteria bacterium]|nr:GNAT family N-acetyltransferase [Acidobacteriota bacterium]